MVDSKQNGLQTYWQLVNILQIMLVYLYKTDMYCWYNFACSDASIFNKNNSESGRVKYKDNIILFQSQVCYKKKISMHRAGTAVH